MVGVNVRSFQFRGVAAFDATAGLLFQCYPRVYVLAEQINTTSFEVPDFLHLFDDVVVDLEKFRGAPGAQ